jgi:hypothetical protein
MGVRVWRATLSRMAKIRGRFGGRLVVVLVVLLAGAGTLPWARSGGAASGPSTVIVTVDTGQHGSKFARGSVGLSVGVQELSSGYLSYRHDRLVRLMRLLGPSVLRIGANTVDTSWWTSSGEPPPLWATNTVTPADLSVLRRLLTATGWRVLLGVDLGHFEPIRAASEARYAQEILGKSLLGIEIGNEPDEFSNRKIDLRPQTYSLKEYLLEVEAYIEALRATVPGIAVYGPATSGTQWLTNMGSGAGIFTGITQHYYATSTCPNVLPSAAMSPPTAVGLLSSAVRQQEDEVLGALAKEGAVAGRPTRIGETNSVSCRGSVSASPVFASALWSLDWVLRAASSGVSGMSFHGWLGGCGRESYSPICVSGDTAEALAGDLTAQPEYYGLLAASQLEGGRFVSTRVVASSTLPNLTTWATVTSGGVVRVAIDNLATTGVAQAVSIPMPGYTATDEPLVGLSVEARSGITFGSVPVSDSGQWLPRPRSLRRRRGSVQVIVRPASAVIITFRPAHIKARRDF